jgi:hypothetical protein
MGGLFVNMRGGRERNWKRSFVALRMTGENFFNQFFTLTHILSHRGTGVGTTLIALVILGAGYYLSGY